MGWGYLLAVGGLGAAHAVRGATAKMHRVMANKWPVGQPRGPFKTPFGPALRRTPAGSRAT